MRLFEMIKKEEIIDVLIQHGVSCIESERLTDNKDNFDLAIKDIQDKTIAEFSTIELSHKAIDLVLDKWKEEQNLTTELGLSRYSISNRNIEELRKRLKEKSLI